MANIATPRGVIDTQLIPETYCAAFCDHCGSQIGWQDSEKRTTYSPVTCNNCMLDITKDTTGEDE